MPPEYIERTEYTELCRRVDNHLEHIDDAMKEISDKVSEMEGCFKTLKWMVGKGITVGAAVGAALAAIIASLITFFA